MTDTGGPVEQIMACPPEALPGEWSSKLVHPGDDGYLVYEKDGTGNRIPDFSYAGYHRSDVPIPDVKVVLEIGPVAGDATAHIQKAIDQVGALKPGPGGVRGALRLKPGVYTVKGTLKQPYSGVVLRGSGAGKDPATNTIVRATGDTPHQRDVLVVGSGVDDGWEQEVPNSRTKVTSALVKVGDFSLTVADASKFKVGDHVVIHHPCTAKWLAAVDHGGTGSDAPWEVGDLPLVFKRQIKAIKGSTLVFDAPFFNTLDRALAQSVVYKHDRRDTVTEVGVEDLRIDIETKGGSDENHAWNAIALRGVEDAWVRRVTALHFGYAGVTVATGVQVTVQALRALDPVALTEGGRMYNFDVSQGQQVLFTHCVARGGRHHYVSNGTSRTSGVVFHRSRSEDTHAPSEGHRRWSMGLLYDNHREVTPVSSVVLGLYNRGDHGTGHGWSSAHSVAWNVDLAGATAIIQRPPGAQNYAIGGQGKFTGASPPAPFKRPAGHIEGSNKSGLFPTSLFEGQLAERRCKQ